jgi:hypothetical protein
MFAIALRVVGICQLVANIVSKVANLVSDVPFEDTLAPCHLNAAACQLICILRAAPLSRLFFRMNAIFNPEINELASALIATNDRAAILKEPSWSRCSPMRVRNQTPWLAL